MLKIENKRCSICKEVESDCVCDWEEIERNANKFKCGVYGSIAVIGLLIVAAVLALSWASVMVDFGR
jgi:hypothetical protein